MDKSSTKPPGKKSSSSKALARFAPVFVLHKREPYWPCAVGDFIRNSRLVVTASGQELLKTIEDPRDVLKYPDAYRTYALDLRDDDDPARRHGARDRKLYPAGVEVYALRQTLAYTEDKASTALFAEPYGAVDLTYALCFAYNGTKEAHKADVEFVVIRLKNDVPVGAYMSNHSGGHWKPWKDIQKTADGRPVFYVARESHAIFHVPGTHRRLLGLANDETQSDGTALAPGAGYTLVDAGDRRKPWLQWPGARSRDFDQGFLHQLTFRTPDKGCAVTDVPAYVATKLPRAALVGLVIGLLVLVAAAVYVNLRFRGLWVRAGAAATAVVGSGGLGMMWLVATANVSVASLESTWWWS